jgi:hypothetical protein
MGKFLKDHCLTNVTDGEPLHFGADGENRLLLYIECGTFETAMV